MADIGAIIEIWLKNNGWTHKMLAERLIVSESTVQKWIKGKRHPDSEMLKKLSEILLIDIKHFYEPNYLPVRFERIDDFVPPCMYGDFFLEILKQLGEEIPEELIKHPLPRQDTCHEVYDAGLYNEATLALFPQEVALSRIRRHLFDGRVCGPNSGRIRSGAVSNS